MRMIGTIPAQDQAERFSDYLVAQDVQNMVEETSAGDWLVWVEHDDHLDRGRSELHAFLANPSDVKYDAASKAERIRHQSEKKSERRRQHFVDVRTTWGQPRQWAVPVTLALIILSAIVSIGTGSIGLGTQRQSLIDKLMFTPPSQFEAWQLEHLDLAQSSDPVVYARFWFDTVIRRGEVWRLFTQNFIHWDLLHLLFNVFWLRDLGAMIEIRRGSWKLIGITLLCGVLCGFAEYFWSGPSYSGGMSGVVYGLFGYVWIKGRFQPQFGVGISRDSSVIMIAWLLLCMTGLLGPIANAAHVGGLIVGAATAYLPYQYKRMRRMIP